MGGGLGRGGGGRGIGKGSITGVSIQYACGH